MVAHKAENQIRAENYTSRTNELIRKSLQNNTLCCPLIYNEVLFNPLLILYISNDDILYVEHVVYGSRYGYLKHAKRSGMKDILPIGIKQVPVNVNFIGSEKIPLEMLNNAINID